MPGADLARSSLVRVRLSRAANPRPLLGPCYTSLVMKNARCEDCISRLRPPRQTQLCVCQLLHAGDEVLIPRYSIIRISPSLSHIDQLESLEERLTGSRFRPVVSAATIATIPI
jgi:hypothetical protein